MWAGSTAPTGWLLCNGAAVSRTTYSDLFAVISTTYGTGNGSTTFNVPDLQRRFPLGA
jgi:microcystin-dependent protein